MKIFLSHFKTGQADHHRNSISLNSMGARYIERITHIEQLLLIEKNVIDTNKLREDCAYGVPDQLRPLCWRLFMDYLPRDRQKWKTTLQKQRKDYRELVENLIVRPGELEDEHEKSQNDLMDHPLAEESTSEWKNFFRDNEVLIQIDRDVRRLRPEIEFFQKKTKFPLTSAARINLAKRLVKEKLVVDKTQLSDNSFITSKASTSDLKADVEDPESERHWQVVERILFIYSKVNSGVKYVQGMNELIGPIYYVFASDSDLEWAEHAEADTFHCFQQLMSEIKDNFIKTLDKSNCGIEIAMKNFYDRLQAHDSQLYNRL
uniref:Rab-GAP TBC domain-containing protein n=1 Tax=Panagrolaimus sp. PS1159 TaxID=55785 RepID=A0AC35FJV0_9BILA